MRSTRLSLTLAVGLLASVPALALAEWQAVDDPSFAGASICDDDYSTCFSFGCDHYQPVEWQLYLRSGSPQVFDLVVRVDNQEVGVIRKMRRVGDNSFFSSLMTADQHDLLEAIKSGNHLELVQVAASAEEWAPITFTLRGSRAAIERFTCPMP